MRAPSSRSRSGSSSAVIRRSRLGRRLVCGFTAVGRWIGCLFTAGTFGLLLFFLLLPQLSLLLLEAIVRAFRHGPSACIRLAPSRVKTARLRTEEPRELRSGGVRRPGPFNVPLFPVKLWNCVSTDSLGSAVGTDAKGAGARADLPGMVIVGKRPQRLFIDAVVARKWERFPGSGCAALGAGPTSIILWSWRWLGPRRKYDRFWHSVARRTYK